MTRYRFDVSRFKYEDNKHACRLNITNYKIVRTMHVALTFRMDPASGTETILPVTDDKIESWGTDTTNRLANIEMVQINIIDPYRRPKKGQLLLSLFNKMTNVHTIRLLDIRGNEYDNLREFCDDLRRRYSPALNRYA